MLNTLSLLVFFGLVAPLSLLDTALAETKINKVVLKNGLAVILVEENKAPVVTFQVWYNVGSRNEITGKTGLSHLLEHMMFKGTPRYGKGVFSRMVAKNGGTENAFTGNDYTAYFENFASDRIALSLELESDRMQNLLIDSNEFELEREVVKEERRSRTDDDPQSSLVETLYATAFLVHPYRNPIIGWMNDLNQLSREDAYQHYKQYYRPDNATVVVVGDFKSETLLPKITALFEKVATGTTPMPLPPTAGVSPSSPSVAARSPASFRATNEPPQLGERRAIVKKEAQLPFIFTGFHAPNYKDPDTYSLAVLAHILSGGKSSRLYQELVYKKQLALEVGGHYEDLTSDPDLFYFYGIPRPGITIETLEKALTEEIKRLQTQKVTELELTKSKNQIEAAFIFGADSNFARAMQIGRAETVGAGQPYLTEYLEHIRKVTADDILRVAQKYLVEDHKSVGILIPLPPKEEHTTPKESE